MFGTKDKKSCISVTNNGLIFVKMIIALSSRSKLLVWSWIMQLMCKLAPKAKSLVCLHDWWQPGRILMVKNRQKNKEY